MSKGNTATKAKVLKLKTAARKAAFGANGRWAHDVDLGDGVRQSARVNRPVVKCDPPAPAAPTKVAPVYSLRIISTHW
jgi:hypothetical protein